MRWQVVGGWVLIVVVVSLGTVVSGGVVVGGPGTVTTTEVGDPGVVVVVGRGTVGRVSRGESARSWDDVINFPAGIRFGFGAGKLMTG